MKKIFLVVTAILAMLLSFSLNAQTYYSTDSLVTIHFSKKTMEIHTERELFASNVKGSNYGYVVGGIVMTTSGSGGTYYVVPWQIYNKSGKCYFTPITKFDANCLIKGGQALSGNLKFIRVLKKERPCVVIMKFPYLDGVIEHKFEIPLPNRW